jgi:hypothetical protein
MLRKTLWWVYGVQAVFVFLVLAGMITREEASFWHWRRAGQPGWDFAGDIYIHLLFYSVFFVAPYRILAAVYAGSPNTTGFCAIIAFWVLTTVCLFHDALFDALGDLGHHFSASAPAWFQWLHILWVAFTVCTVFWWRALSKEKTERRVRVAVEEVYEAWRRERGVRSGQ